MPSRPHAFLGAVLLIAVIGLVFVLPRPAHLPTGGDPAPAVTLSDEDKNKIMDVLSSSAPTSTRLTPNEQLRILQSLNAH